MRFAYALPSFDEKRNSFSKLLAPIVASLLARGHEVAIYSGNRDYRGAFASQHRYVAHLRVPLHFVSFFLLLLATSLRIVLDHRRQPFDVIHNLGCGSSLVQNVITAHASHWAWVARKKLYGEAWRVLVNPTHWLALAVEQYNYHRRAATVICVSQVVAKQISWYHPATAGHLRVIENGMTWRELSGAGESRIAGNGDRPRLTIGFASNNHATKGLYYLLEALKLARAQALDWQLVVLGVDPKQKLYEHMAARLGVGDLVHFKGHVDDVIGELSRTDVFCLPSKYESFGMVFLEAANAGRPIVASGEGVFPQLLEGFDRTVPLEHPVDGHELFRQLRRLSEDEQLARDLARHLSAKARNFSEKTMVEQTLSVYEEITGRPI